MNQRLKTQLTNLVKHDSKTMLFLYNGLYEKVTAGIKNPISWKDVIDLLKKRPDTKIYMFVADLRRFSWDTLNIEGTAPNKSIPSELKGYNVQVNITDSDETIKCLMGIKIGISINSVTNNY